MTIPHKPCPIVSAISLMVITETVSETGSVILPKAHSRTGLLTGPFPIPKRMIGAWKKYPIMESLPMTIFRMALSKCPRPTAGFAIVTNNTCEVHNSGIEFVDPCTVVSQ